MSYHFLYRVTGYILYIHLPHVCVLSSHAILLMDRILQSRRTIKALCLYVVAAAAVVVVVVGCWLLLLLWLLVVVVVVVGGGGGGVCVFLVR